VPHDGEAKISGTRPVGGEFVFFMEGGEKMLSISLFEVFDTKVINGKDESCWAAIMMPEARGIFDGAIAMVGKMFAKLFICKYGSFLETIHSFAYLNVDVTFGIKMS
jgi:hypothetical protein